jgi:hypothetical protein
LIHPFLKNEKNFQNEFYQENQYLIFDFIPNIPKEDLMPFEQ